MTFLETYVGTPVGVLSLIDEFAMVRGARGFLPVPIPPLRFSLIAREINAVMTPLDEIVELPARSTPTGTYIFGDEASFRDRQRGAKPEVHRIPPGRFRMRVDSLYYQPLQLDFEWPPPQPPLPANIQQQFLRPGYAYPFPDVTLTSTHLTLLRGVVLRGVSGTPVAGATVEITDPPALGPFVMAITDDNGAWALAFPHPNANDIIAEVTITGPPADPFVLVIANVTLEAGADNSLSYTALRGAALFTNGNPIEDAEISVDIIPNESVRTDRNGLWTFYCAFDQLGVPAQVTALAPNGNSQSVNVVITNHSTTVVPTFRIAM